MKLPGPIKILKLSLRTTQDAAVKEVFDALRKLGYDVRLEVDGETDEFLPAKYEIEPAMAAPMKDEHEYARRFRATALTGQKERACAAYYWQHGSLSLTAAAFQTMEDHVSKAASKYQPEIGVKPMNAAAQAR